MEEIKMTTRSKIALVTGGSRGLGRNMALRLAQDGKDVILTYFSQKEQALAVTAEIEALGRKAAALQLDVGNIPHLNEFVRLFKEILVGKWDQDRQYGKLHHKGSSRSASASSFFNTRAFL